LSVASAFDRTPADGLIRSEDIDDMKLVQFFSGQKETAATSGPLADVYRTKANQLDGIISYESELLSLNDTAEDNRLERLELIYPSDGAVYASYPLILVNPARENEYRRILDWLLKSDTQEILINRKHRRPPTTAAVAPNTPKEQQLPTELKIANRLVLAYLNEYRKRTRTLYVLDISHSMEPDQRIGQLRRAFDLLIGEDQSVAGQFAHFRKNEKITIVPFNSEVLRRRDFDIAEPSTNPPVLRELSSYVHNDLIPAGSTALYEALLAAYEIVRQEGPNEGYITSIVLMTDGEANVGVDRDGQPVNGERDDAPKRLFEGFQAQYEKLSYGRLGVRTHVIKFGEASEDDMRKVAGLTGGQFFDATKSSLYEAFREIRGFQ
jgi:Ca-activated chloride channel family protein